MSSSPTYLVSGATGAQGGGVVRELLKAGFRVHALVRDAAKAKDIEALGAVLFVGDFSDVDAINKATVGVKGIFLNPWPDHSDPLGEAKVVQRFVDAAKAAGTVEHLVLSTSLKTAEHKKWLAEDPDYPPALKHYYTSKSAAEDVVRNSGVKYWTIFRPPWLYRNYTFPSSGYHFPQLHTDRILSTAMPRDLPTAHFDGADLGYWAAAAFSDPAKFASKEILLGTESLTLEQVVAGLEKFTGVKITTKWLDPAEVAKDTSDPFAPIRAAVASFQIKYGSDLTPEEYDIVKSYGLPATNFEAWLEKDKKDVFETLKIST